MESLPIFPSNTETNFVRRSARVSAIQKQNQIDKQNQLEEQERAKAELARHCLQQSLKTSKAVIPMLAADSFEAKVLKYSETYPLNQRIQQQAQLEEDFAEILRKVVLEDLLAFQIAGQKKLQQSVAEAHAQNAFEIGLCSIQVYDDFMDF